MEQEPDFFDKLYTSYERAFVLQDGSWLTPAAWVRRLRHAKLHKQCAPSAIHQPYSHPKEEQAFYSEQESKPLVTNKRSESATTLQFSPLDQM